MAANPGEIRLSASTWQQPFPAAASAQRSALLARVAESVLSCGDGRVRVVIDGLTAAGKTSFGHELAQHIGASGRPVLRASLDDFKKPWRDRHLYDRESGEGYYRNAFDDDAIVRLLLRPAGPTGSGECVLCSIDPLTQIEHRDVVTFAPADAVLIVDGVFALRPRLNDYWDFRIWLDVDEATSISRGVARDQDWAGADAEAVHRDRYLVAARWYLSEVDPLRLVDLVIDNTAFDRARILRARRGV
ncbi:MAG TPA: uridine kinase [Micromonosporaceae bacterium]